MSSCDDPDPHPQSALADQTQWVAQRALALADGPGSAEDRLQQIRAELRQILADAEARMPGKPAPATLNDRQLKTLRLVAQGLSNRSIARRMDVAEETVKCHVRSLLDRLNMPNRTALALWAVREGMVPLYDRDAGRAALRPLPLRSSAGFSEHAG